MIGHATEILREAGDFFIANVDDGRMRIGILGDKSVDTPHDHDELLAVAAIEDDAEFETAASDLFDRIFLQ